MTWDPLTYCGCFCRSVFRSVESSMNTRRFSRVRLRHSEHCRRPFRLSSTGNRVVRIYVCIDGRCLMNAFITLRRHFVHWWRCSTKEYATFEKVTVRVAGEQTFLFTRLHDSLAHLSTIDPRSRVKMRFSILWMNCRWTDCWGKKWWLIDFPRHYFLLNEKRFFIMILIATCVKGSLLEAMTLMLASARTAAGRLGRRADMWGWGIREDPPNRMSRKSWMKTDRSAWECQ